MNKIEIETITEAMAMKQTWIRKELDDFLKVWAEITKENISGHEKFILDEYSTSEEAYVTNRIYLRRGVAEIDVDFYDGYAWENCDNYLDLDDQPIARIRQIIKRINESLTHYFKNIQKDIRDLDEISMQIRSIIEKLK